MMETRQALHDALIKMVVQTRQGILAIYNDSERWSTEDKSDGSPVTEADKYVHYELMAGLSELDATIPILSEEGRAVAWSERQQWQRYWIIDPIDGTKDFIGRTDEFTVNVALIKNNQPVVSVVYSPVEDVLYSAIKGEGSFRIANDATEAITTRALHSPATIAVSRNHRCPKIERWLARYTAAFGSYEEITIGSSLKMCRLAEGCVDVHAKIGPTCEWDTAAAQLIVEEAGGALLLANGEPMRYNTKESLLNPAFLVLGDTTRDWQELLYALGDV